jgi:predicted dehydrogenase
MKIGFIDYYLDEWHANNYPRWIRESPANTSGAEPAFAWGERDSPGGLSSAAWSRNYGAEPCGSIEEVCEKSGCLLILAPDHSEKHLEYARRVLPFGKPVYIDKTFAPNLQEAEEIFALAERYSAPLCSSSALRFAAEIAEFNGNALSVISSGGGPSFDTYAVHQMEMIVKVMGTGAEKVMALMNGGNKSLAIRFRDGRGAQFNQAAGSSAPFTVSVETGETVETEKKAEYRPIESDFFRAFIDHLLVFYETGKTLALKEETLSVIALIDAGKQALAEPLRWIGVPGLDRGR